MKMTLHKALVVFAAVIALAALGCGSVSGSTYQAGGGAIQIEFQSGGKAILSLGPLKTPCTYVEDSKTVTITCEGDKSVFTKESNGTLSPPPGNMIGPMTKK